MRWPQVGGIVLALLGVLHVIVKGEWGALGSVQFVVGDWWIVAAMIAWALYALLQKVWTSPLGATARLAAICGGSMPFLLAARVNPVKRLSCRMLGIFAALVPGVMAYWIYGWAQKILGASKVAVTLYLGPLYGAMLAWWVLGETLGWHHLWGGALILPGVYLVSTPS
jgi:drug/metabolite transporter (DMT)-like permease